MLNNPFHNPTGRKRVKSTERSHRLVDNQPAIKRVILKSRSELCISTCGLSVLTVFLLSRPIGRSPISCSCVIHYSGKAKLFLSLASLSLPPSLSKVASQRGVNHFCSTRNNDDRAKLDHDRLAPYNRFDCFHACISPCMRYVIPLSCSYKAANDKGPLTATWFLSTNHREISPHLKIKMKHKK